MKMKIILGILLVFLIANISAVCDDGQIDINSASIEKLDLLYGVGLKVAQNIIDGRPFDNVDDLIRANRIGNFTLGKIKEDGLACVSFEEVETEEEVIETDNDVYEEDGKETEIGKENGKGKAHSGVPQEGASTSSRPPDIKLGGKNVERELINLNPKDIKTDEDKKNLGKSDYTIYGFGSFCVLLLFLFIVKNKNRFNKNEFR